MIIKMNKIIDLDKFNHYKTVKTIDDQYISANPNDIYIGNKLINNGAWEMHIINLLKAICNENMTVIDIGANIGTYTILMSKLVGEKGNVYAFEPFKNHIEILFYNLMMNDCFNTKIYSYGCGEKNENMFIDKKFLNTKRCENFGAIELKKDYSDKDEEIEIKSIDSFEFPKIDIIKIDVHGMENVVINGMKNTILKYTPVIIIEIHDPELENMKNIFDSINYSLQRIGHTWDFVAIPK
jgi:FkbM family methyltransferase